MQYGATGPNFLARPGGFGALVTGVRLSGDLATAVRETLANGLATYRFLLFPDQTLEPEQLVLAASAFGTPRKRRSYLDGENPYLQVIRREADETVVPFGAGWHSDGSFRDAPDLATALYAQVVPPEGGDTLFADTVAAYDALPSPMKAKVERLTGLHSAEAYFGRRGFYAQERGRTGMTISVSTEFERTVSHPVVYEDPKDGVRSLFVNPGFTVGIEGMDGQSGQALLKALFDHMLEERFVYRHRWKPNMLVVWHNRRTLHCATGGYDGFLRVMHRVSLDHPGL